VDPLGGLNDLGAGRVRFVGEPARRIAEDYLRILRFFRFTARLSRQGVDAEGLAACAAGVPGLARLSRERIGHEMRRLLATADPAEAVSAMAGAGVLAAIAPWAETADLSALVAIEAETGAAPRWQRRLAALGPTAQAGEAWRLSKAERRELAALEIARADAPKLPPAGLAHLHGIAAARDALLLAATLGQAVPRGLEADLMRGSTATFPIGAQALMEAGVPPGPALGQTLAKLKWQWAEADCGLSAADLLASLA
jgi:poly(A) polymerase